MFQIRLCVSVRSLVSALVAGSLSAACVVTTASRVSAQVSFLGLGDLAGGIVDSAAFGVSSDGSVVVGYGTAASGHEAMHWTLPNTVIGLGDLAGGSVLSEAYGVSGDGQVVVGRGTSGSGVEAFRWTQAGSMVGLSDLPGGGFDSESRGVSGDGSAIVGRGFSAIGSEAFRWTQATGMVGLGDLAGGDSYSVANGVSADGTVIVGLSGGINGLEAFFWNASAGMVNLKDFLIANYSSSLPSNFNQWTLSEASDVSGDGTTIVGTGRNPNGQSEAFRVRLASGFASAGASAAPEPGAMTLLEVGGLVLLAARRWRKSGIAP